MVTEREGERGHIYITIKTVGGQDSGAHKKSTGMNHEYLSYVKVPQNCCIVLE